MLTDASSQLSISVAVITRGPYINAPTHMGVKGVLVSFFAVAAVSILSGPKSMCGVKGIVISTISLFFHLRAGIVTYELGRYSSATDTPLSLMSNPSVAQYGTRNFMAKRAEPRVMRMVECSAGHWHSWLIVTCF